MHKLLEMSAEVTIDLASLFGKQTSKRNEPKEDEDETKKENTE